MIVLLLLLLSCTCNLQYVDKGPPTIEDGYTEKYVAEEDDLVKLHCPIAGNPKPIIEWYQDDQLIHPMWDRFRVNRKTLKIKAVTLADSGIFECKGVNGFGSISVQIHLTVKNRKDSLMKSNKIETLLNEVHSQILVPKQHSGQKMAAITPASGIAPQIIFTTLVQGEAIHKRTGDTLKLECQVDGIPPPSIVWYKDGDILLTPNSRSDRTQTLMMIPNLGTKDAGTYWCKSRNVWGEVNATFPVKIYEELEPPQILGPMSSSNQENYTVPLGGQTVLQCAVRSLGPTQIQWLKQLHDHQAPTDRNKTIVVFDYIFEILEPTSEMEDSSAGIHNTTLKLGPPAQFMHAGRYICLVNNPEGHTHKEIFVRVLTDSQLQNSMPDSAGEDSGTKNSLVIRDFPETSEEPLPIGIMILIPILSSGLILLILAVVCVRRTGSSSSSSGSATSSPLVKMSSMSNGHDGHRHNAASGSNCTLQTLNKRLSSLHHFYAKPWAVGTSASHYSNEVATGPNVDLHIGLGEEDEGWVEVTNKANQTPSHWVYNDMTLEAADNLVVTSNLDLITYPYFTSFNNSQTSSPRFIQRSESSPYHHVYSNDQAPPPPPPPYPPHLSTVMPLRTRSPMVQPRLLNVMHSAPPTTTPPPAPPLKQQRRRRNASDNEKMIPQFYALVKDHSGSELYARPPSDHFYFKITDGKTEFI